MERWQQLGRPGCRPCEFLALTSRPFPVGIAFGQIQLFLSVLELFLDVFLISLDLPLHLRADGRKLFIRFVAWSSPRNHDQSSGDGPTIVTSAG